MSRESRKLRRKARNSELSTPPTTIHSKLDRDPSTRWEGLTARGGQKLGFTPAGSKIPVDLDDPAAPFALHMSACGGGVIEE